MAQIHHLQSPCRLVDLTFCLHLSPPAGHRRKPGLAGLVTDNSPQEKQPFLVAFFRANEVRFRSVRSAHGHKGRHSSRSKPQRTVHDALKAVEAAKGARLESIFRRRKTDPKNLLGARNCVFLFSENLGSSKEGCKKHELYVSFRDLGWQVQIRALQSNFHISFHTR